MDLFKIERFGVESVQKESVKELQEKTFQKKIEKRKRQKEKDSKDLKFSNKKKKEIVEVEEQITELNEEKTEKSREDCKDDIENHEVTNIEDNNENENVQEEETEILFPILGKQQHSSKTPSKRNLPRWLAEPRILASDLNDKNSKIDKFSFLSENSIQNLQRMNISYLFPVQSHVVPAVMDLYTNVKSCYPRRDVCVQSPTGSGKTLSYVLPVVEILSKNIIKELQCLVILPTKDLAAQVKSTFDQCIIGTNLKVGLIAGVKSISKEQENIIVSRPSGYHSLVDILVCSPGRLVDHLKFTPGFTLSKLKFLVIDEADRLLSDNYDNWLSLSMKSIQSSNNQKIYPLTASKFTNVIHHVQKFLFSATLTENPEKIAALDLFNPLLFLSQTSSNQDDCQENSMKKYAVPNQLVEKMVVVEAHQKPVTLIHIMLKLQYKCVLCFTNSIESTHRLYLLLQRFDGIRAAEFSSQLNETQRKGVLRDFRKEKVNLLIATDAMSRGMDIKNVDLVVNYDAPNNAKTYVHRVGRTARGGGKGEAITVLVTKEVYHFKQMHQTLGSTKPIQKITFAKTSLSCYEEEYEEALQELRKQIQNEKKKT